MSELKATPTTAEAVSPESRVAGVEEPKIVHGQAGAVACGVTGLVATLAGPVPTALVAATVKVYVASLVSPVTVADTAEPATVLVGWAAVPMNGVIV